MFTAALPDPSSAPTPSPSSTPSPSAAASKRSIYTDTALHVLKGAIVSILGPSAALTSSVSFSHPNKAQLTIVYPSTDPISPAAQLQIERLANETILANIPIKQLIMPRAEAEAHYKDHLVNSTYIYDRFPVPASVDPLTLTLIDGVNINCCRGPHTETTGELRCLKILKTKKSKLKEKDGSIVQQYEFLFAVREAAEEVLEKQKEDANKSMKVKEVKEEVKNEKVGKEGAEGKDGRKEEVKVRGGTEGMPAFEKWKPSTPSHIQRQASELLAVLKGKGVSAEVVAGLEEEVLRRLTMFSNQCYTMGMQAAKDVTLPDRASLL